jgi:hypothetical protein
VTGYSSDLLHRERPRRYPLLSGLRRPAATLYALLLASLALIPVNARAAGIVVGANVAGVDWASDQTQDALLDELQRYHVTTIRTALGGHDDRYTSFVIKAFNRGIGSVVMVDPCAGNTQKHALPPDAKAGRPWGLAALSDADSKGFSQWFAPTLARLEAAHVRITAFELGNELNTPRFNADFRPEQATSRVMGAAELNNPRDKEAATVVSGYRAYLGIMATLKELRDHAMVNQKTPILTGMSANWGAPHAVARGSGQPDAVSVNDSIEFLRHEEIDRFADGYAVHIYPDGNPNLTLQSRVATLEASVLAACGRGARPCWMTEWGFNNPMQSCPLNDTARMRAVEAERAAFQEFARQGRLSAILFYSWSGVVPRSWEHAPPKTVDPGSIFRCGVLTDAGKAALAPL